MKNFSSWAAHVKINWTASNKIHGDESKNTDQITVSVISYLLWNEQHTNLPTIFRESVAQIL